MSREGTIYRVCTKCRWSSKETSLKKCGRSGCDSRSLNWTWQLDIAPPGAKRKRISRSFATKDEARDALDEYKGQLRKGGFSQGSGAMTLSEWMTKWLEREERRVRNGTLKPRTHEGYAAHLRVYVEGSSIAGIRIDRLTREALEAFYDVLADKPLSPSSVHRVHATIRRSLSDAVNRGILVRNPATGAHQAPTHRSRDIDPWDASEVASFLDSKEARADRHRVAFHLAAMTGLRRGELLALRWRDIGLDTRTLTVTRALVRSKEQGLLIGEPKTQAARRTISLDQRTVDLLRRHQTAQRQERRWRDQDGDVTPDSLVFGSESGRPLDPDAFTRHFQRLVKRAGVRRCRLHDLRHAHASHLISIGKSAVFIQHRLGHSKIEVTLGTYGHLFSAMEQSDVDEAADLIYGAGGTG